MQGEERRAKSVALSAEKRGKKEEKREETGVTREGRNLARHRSLCRPDIGQAL